MIHADLKPENVSFTEDKKLKLGIILYIYNLSKNIYLFLFNINLADFGLSRQLREEKDYTSVDGGCWAYLAPELLPTNRK
jgi:serine/threonine protein kinase